MSNCQSCGTLLEGDEKFCGSCGAPVQKAAKPKERSQAETKTKPEFTQEPDTHPSSAPKSSKNETKIFASVIIALLAIGGGIYFLSTSGDEATQAAQRPIATQPAVVSNAPAQQPSGATTSATSPSQTSSNTQPETISDAVQVYIAQATQANIDAGIAGLAPHRLSVPACSNCAPILIYCVDPIQSVSDLKGRAVRAHSTAAKDLVTRVGGNLQLLMFGEVSQAMQMGLIDCSMSGGIVPQ